MKKQIISPEFSAFVSASAGTGKTKTLIDRLLNLLLHDVKPNKILCLAFTKAAAAEILERINQKLSYFAICSQEKLIHELYELGFTDPTPDLEYRARILFAKSLDETEPLNIQTIHAFCQQLLLKFPFEAGVNLNFTLLNENKVSLLIEQAKNRLLTNIQTYAKAEQALHYLSWHIKEYTLKELLEEIISNRNKLDHFFDLHSSLDNALNSLEFDIDENEIIAEFIQNIPIKNHHLEILYNGSKTDIARAMKIKEFLDSSLQTMLLTNYLDCFLTKTGDPLKSLLTKKIATPELLMLFEDEQQRVDKFNIFFKHIKTINLTKAFITLSYYIREIYKQLKEQNNSLDYDDLISICLDLLNNTEHAQWIQYKLDGGIEHILVDEAQDNSSVQWSIINKIYENFDNNKSIFIVGDAKQSIFSFQGAEPELFNNMNHTLSDNVIRKQLNQSFRSGAEILQLVDKIFNQSHIKPLVTAIEDIITHKIYKTSPASIELWPLIIEEDINESKEWRLPSEIKQNTIVSADEMLADRIIETIKDQNPGDILILTRRRTKFIGVLINALRKANIPTAGLDRLKLMEHPAILDLIALTNFILCPADDLNLAITLKSPICNLSEDELFALCNQRTGSLWEYMQETQHPKVEFLQNIQNIAKNNIPSEFYFAVLEYQGLRATFDEDSNDILDAFLDLILEYESENIPSLQLFLSFLNNTKTEVKRDLSQAKGKVRIMTVHNAKGLQSPIVILTDTTSLPHNNDTIIWLNEQKLLWPGKEKYSPDIAKEAKAAKIAKEYAEYLRLLYVALTRAESQLIICGTDKSEEISEKSWYKIIQNALN